MHSRLDINRVRHGGRLQYKDFSMNYRLGINWLLALRIRVQRLKTVIGKFTIAAGEMRGRARIAILADRRRFIRNFAMDHFSRD